MESLKALHGEWFKWQLQSFCSLLLYSIPTPSKNFLWHRNISSTPEVDFKQSEMLHWNFFWCLYTDPNIGLIIQQDKIIAFLSQRQKALVSGCSQWGENYQACPFFAWLVGGVKQKLQALRQHFMLVCLQRRIWLRLCDETGTQLEFKLLHLVDMQVLLNQVAFPFNPRLHIWRDVRDHPRHEKLHHKHHMLQRKSCHMIKI